MKLALILLIMTGCGATLQGCSTQGINHCTVYPEPVSFSLPLTTAVGVQLEASCRLWE